MFAGRDARLRLSMLRAAAEEREARSLALEKAYVHDVYEQISGSAAAAAARGTPAEAPGPRAWPKVKQFLAELEPGSLVCDVGQFRLPTYLPYNKYSF